MRKLKARELKMENESSEWEIPKILIGGEGRIQTLN